MEERPPEGTGGDGEKEVMSDSRPQAPTLWPALWLRGASHRLASALPKHVLPVCPPRP